MYDLAVDILVELRALAEYESRLPTFEAQIQQLVRDYPTLSGLKTRLTRRSLYTLC